MEINVDLESRQIERARKKLKEKFDAIEKNVTPEALKAAEESIRESFARSVSYRITCPKKEIGLFDSNRNPAPPSDKVVRFAQSLLK